MIFTLIKIELFKTFAKWRTYIGFIAIGVLFPVIMYFLKTEGGGIVDSSMRSIKNEFLISGNLFNAWVVTEFIMNSLWIHVPFLIVLVAGDMLSGEATAGTFRFSLIRPITRTEFLISKFIVNLFYASSLLIFMWALCVGLGLYLFGSGDLVSLADGMITIIPESEAAMRIALAFGLAIISMWVVASLAFLFSSFIENAIGPIIGTMAIMVFSLIISNLPVDAVGPYKPYLFTTYQSVWLEAFKYEIDWVKISDSIIALGINIFAFFLISYFIFIRKDIRS